MCWSSHALLCDESWQLDKRSTFFDACLGAVRGVCMLSLFTLALTLPLRCRYCWALVHSPSQDHVWQGLSFAEALLGGPGMTEHNNKEVIYLSAVAKYKLGKHVDARRQVQELLKVSFVSCHGSTLC